MVFQLTKSQKEIQKAAREFAKDKFDKDLCLEQDKKGHFPGEIRKKAAELGFIGIHYPEAYNGGDFGVFENVLLAEEFCKKDASIGTALMLSGFSAECLLRFGDDVLKSRWLPPVADGEVLAAAAFTEPDTGASLDGIRSTAREEAGEWVIDGLKTEVLNGGEAGFYCILAQTEKDAQPPEALSLILSEAERPGLVVENRRDKLGMRMSATTDLRFNAVRVPANHLIGKRGQGLELAFRFYEETWILIAAMALGTARGALARAVEHVKKRVQFGRKIVQFQVTQHKISDMGCQIEQTAAFVYRTAKSFDHGENRPEMSAMAKLSACKTAIAVTSEAIQLLGGYGYMREEEVERFYRNAKAMELFCGHPAFLKDYAASAIIGKIK